MRTPWVGLLSALVSFLRLRKGGRVQIEDIMHILARIWKRTGNKSLLLYARELAADVSMLNTYEEAWQNWNESLFTPDAVRGKILFRRKREKELIKWGNLSKDRKAQVEENVKMLEGELILMDFVDAV